MSSSFIEYVNNINLKEFFSKLDALNAAALAENVRHFTTKEGDKRDSIVCTYFGEVGVNRIVDAIVERLLAPPALRIGSKVLDVGAGSGFFTTRIAQKILCQVADVGFYAIDVTPAMLLALANKSAAITPFLGIAENIRGSMQEAKAYAVMPDNFDAVFSTLMLHHSVNPEKVFESISKVLAENGKAVVLDLCEHKFEEFKSEMGDLHSGFRLSDIQKMAETFFLEVKIEKIHEIGCTCSGRTAEIFAATMQKPARKTVI